MVYILAIFFVVVSFANMARGRVVKIRPGVNQMDMISIVMVGVIFAIFAAVLKSDVIQTIALALSMMVYIYSTRYSRGITNRGVMIAGGNPLLVREYLFKDLKQVNVKNEDDLVAFSIVIRDKNTVDIQRYAKEEKPALVKIFKDEGVEIIYK